MGKSWITEDFLQLEATIPRFISSPSTMMIRCFFVSCGMWLKESAKGYMASWNPSSVLLCAPKRYLNVGLKTPVGEIMDILVTKNQSEISKPLSIMYLIVICVAKTIVRLELCGPQLCYCKRGPHFVSIY